MPTRGQRRLAKTQKINTLASEISNRTHFTSEDCRALLSMHERMSALGKVDRLRFRELLHSCFGITDDIMLDLTFRAFDKNSDGVVDENEFIVGLSSMLRGSLDELIDFCYFVYDMNGDKSLAREELFQCLKGCIVPGYGVDFDEIDDAEKDIVEMIMKKLDVNKDGQITFDDFQNAVHADPLLVQAIGPCLPTPSNVATFLSTITFNYRAHAGCYTDRAVTPESERPRQRIRLQSRAGDGGERFTKVGRTSSGMSRATHIGRPTAKGRATHKQTLAGGSNSSLRKSGKSIAPKSIGPGKSVGPHGKSSRPGKSLAPGKSLTAVKSSRPGKTSRPGKSLAAGKSSRPGRSIAPGKSIAPSKSVTSFA